MATARETINLGLRKARVRGRGDTPSSAEVTDALSDLNALLLWLWDVKLARPFTPVRVSGAYAVCRETTSVRLMCVAAAGITLPCSPLDGARVHVIDVNSVGGITIARNAMLIEGAGADLTLAAGDNKRWLFRADLGDWRLAADIAVEDDLPWPEEFHYGLALVLAKRMSEYAQPLNKDDSDLADETLRLMRARYVKPGLLRPDGAISSMSPANGSYGGASPTWDGGVG